MKRMMKAWWLARAGVASCLVLASASADAFTDPLSPPPVGDMPLPAPPSPSPSPSPPPAWSPPPSSAPPPASSLPSTGARAAYDEGQALLARKRYAEAIDALKQATTAEPTFAPGWFALALAARRAGRCGEAVPAYRHYAALRPGEAEPYFGIGLCLRDSGDQSGALVALKKFVALGQRPGQEKWIETARAMIATLEAPAAAVTPGPGTAAYEEAQRLRDAGRIEEALARFAEAAELEPDLMTARAAWGELLVKINRDAEAVGVFRRAVDRNAQYPLIWYELAFALRETGRFEDAIEAYRRYIQLRPADPDPHYGLGRALSGLGKSDDAIRSYQTYIAMENRPGEGRWVASARAEIASLDKGRDGGRPAKATARTPAPTSLPPATPAATTEAPVGAAPSFNPAPAAPARAPLPSAPARDRAPAPPRQ